MATTAKEFVQADLDVASNKRFGVGMMALTIIEFIDSGVLVATVDHSSPSDELHKE